MVGTDGEARQNGMTEPFMSMYPYWLNYPYGWNYPAACTNSGKPGGWAASVDQQHGKLLHKLYLTK